MCLSARLRVCLLICLSVCLSALSVHSLSCEGKDWSTLLTDQKFLFSFYELEDWGVEHMVVELKKIPTRSISIKFVIESDSYTELKLFQFLPDQGSF